MEPAPELILFMERLYRSYAAFDAEAVNDGVARNPGSLVIGTAPDEWHVGYDAIAPLFRVQFQEMPPVQFEVENIVAWKEGTVGWIASRALLVIEGMPSVSTRATVVLHEEGAHWRIVQWHFSVPVANEEALGVGLTANVDEILTMVQDDGPPVTAMGPDGSITVMFTDIEGSTALMETLGEVSWLELLEWHDRALRQQTTLFGGSVVKNLGDGFMLGFPAGGSAAACAIAIQRSLSTGWAGVPVAVRIGMHSGNAKAEAGDFFGRTVVVAARVAAAATGGEILVSQAVQEGLDGAFPLGGARSLTLKGLVGHHSVFPVLWS
jgi:class 3 adenylate cyclase